jgi:hypothetical protein
MDKRKQTLYETMLARISLGAVPVDGIYWFDPRSAREAAAARLSEAQAAKVAPFADGSEADVRKSAEGGFFPSTIEAKKARARQTGAQHERSDSPEELNPKRAASASGEDRAAGEGSGCTPVPSTCR